MAIAIHWGNIYQKFASEQNLCQSIPLQFFKKLNFKDPKHCALKLEPSLLLPFISKPAIPLINKKVKNKLVSGSFPYNNAPIVSSTSSNKD